MSIYKTIKTLGTPHKKVIQFCERHLHHNDKEKESRRGEKQESGHTERETYDLLTEGIS